MSAFGTMPLAPVRTSVPSIFVTCATRTPATSVIPSTAPLGNAPIATGVRAPAGSMQHATTAIAAAAKRITPRGTGSYGRTLAGGENGSRSRAQRLVHVAQCRQAFGIDPLARIRPIADRLVEQPAGQRVVGVRP